MSGYAAYGPSNGVKKDPFAGLPIKYEFRSHYQPLDGRVLLSLDFGVLSELIEDLLDDRMSEQTGDTEWEATGRDYRDPEPYESPKEREKGTEYTFLKETQETDEEKQEKSK